MSEEESTLNLQALQDEVKRLGAQTGWRLTFSYGRALQSATLKVRLNLETALPLCLRCLSADGACVLLIRPLQVTGYIRVRQAS